MNLFDPEPCSPEGMRYRADVFSAGHEFDLLAWIDAQPWTTDLSRRTQFYGWKYDYRLRSVHTENKLGPLPKPIQYLAEHLLTLGLLSSVPDQALVNEYLPGQGIAPHIDCEPCFGDEIAMVSLGDTYPMDFAHPEVGQYCAWLEHRSACIISGPARWEWTHGIAKRRSDPVQGGGRQTRGRRASVTYRTVVI